MCSQITRLVKASFCTSGAQVLKHFLTTLLPPPQWAKLNKICNICDIPTNQAFYLSVKKGIQFDIPLTKSLPKIS